jgi:large subunit ribosomal protein L30
MAKQIIVTQVKSAIKKPKRQKDTLVALGIRGLNRPVEKTATPQILGMINKVQHLLKVVEK